MGGLKNGAVSRSTMMRRSGESYIFSDSVLMSFHIPSSKTRELVMCLFGMKLAATIMWGIGHEKE